MLTWGSKGIPIIPGISFKTKVTLILKIKFCRYQEMISKLNNSLLSTSTQVLIKIDWLQWLSMTQIKENESQDKFRTQIM